MRFSTIAATVLLLAASATLAAADLKIAVVDLEDIFNNYYKTKISASNLKKQAEVFKAYAKKLEDSRQKLYDEFKQLRDESQNIAFNKLEQENKRIQAQEKYRQLKAKEAELTQYNQSKFNQLKEERTKMRQELIDEIKTEVAKRAALSGYTIVLDKSGSSLNNIPLVVYYSPAVDISPSVLQELNRGYTGKAKPAEAGKDAAQ